MLHFLFLFRGLQLPEEVQPVGGLCLVAVDCQRHCEGQHHSDQNVLCGNVVVGAVPEQEKNSFKT